MTKVAAFLCTAASCAIAHAAVFSFTNDHAVLTFDGLGRAVSLRERSTGRELLERPAPFAGAGVAATGGYVGSNRSELRDGRVHLGFPDGFGHVVLSVDAFAGGFTFTVDEFHSPKAKVLYLGRVNPSPKKWLGRRANMASDEKSGLCVRAYDLHQTMQIYPGLLQVRIPAERAAGSRFGVVGTSRGRLRAALQAMTLASGRPHSAAGGAWALDSEAARGSYLNANVTAATLDDWILLAERGGFDVVHFRENWYSCRGHYPVNRRDWPGGLDDLKAAVAKVHAAGFRAGLHTLSGCIDPKDPWVAGSEKSQLIALASYTLAEDLPAAAAEMVVNEKPKVRHDTVFTYSGNGNAFRIGDEIVQYSGFSGKPPYRFTGLTRGAFGTVKSDHAKGEAADYLQQRYIAFYPEPDSTLADSVADAIANVYLSCGFDQIYCDGAEGMFTPYGTATMRDKIMSRCIAGGKACLNEDSVGCPAHCWWYHSRVGAWDSCFWAPKRFHDFHVAKVKEDDVRNADLLEVQMGWWAPLLSTPHCSAHKLDDMEYYASRNAGLDASMSVASVNLAWKGLRYHVSRMMTVLGWYERARRARAFRPPVQKSFDRQGAEFRLRQNMSSGEWEVSAADAFRYRAVSSETEKFCVRLSNPAEKTALRVEALYTGDGAEGKGCVLTAGMAARDFKYAVSGTNVTVTASDGRTDCGGRAFRVTARNSGKVSKGAWARASFVFSPYRKPENRRVMRFSVKGDGSGALLNVQPVSPPEYGRSLAEHYVTLDFTGWRDFEMPLRERDADKYADYDWPYTWYASVFHSVLKVHAISEINFYLNAIPAGGTASAEITDVTFVPERPLKILRHGVKMDGKIVPVPFEMESGQYAELEDGFWTLYSADGDPLRRRRATVQVPALKTGRNQIVYRAETADGSRPRAEISVFAVGKPRPALVHESALPEAARGILAYEAVDPQYYAPHLGFDALNPVVVRPGRVAAVEVTVYGPTSGCRLKVGDTAVDIPAVAKGENRTVPLAGEFKGVNPVVVEAPSDGNDFAARLEFAKRYR